MWQLELVVYIEILVVTERSRWKTGIASERVQPISL
jgi:hypothetical protein